jgi:type II secretory pathway predicted ATPase ExeA
LLDGLSRNQIAFAFVYNPMLSVLEFLSHVLTDLRLPSSAISKSEMLSRLNNFLVARAQRGQITALVVDEAQLLSWELLEEIRLLTNLETSEYKLLQIVLAGQPELDGKLDSHELRQLKQRIGLRCSLEPLKLKELSGYIYRRLELAGANSQGNAIFSDEAIDSIYLLSRGIPRLVNIICDNSMISGYGTQTKQITPDIIHSVAMDLRLNNVTASPLLRPGDSKLLRSLFNVIEEL